jgi:hypothetical protein
MLKLFTRKTLKKIIMTISYSVSCKSAIEYFYDAIKNIELSDEITDYNHRNKIKKKKNVLFKKIMDEIKDISTDK